MICRGFGFITANSPSPQTLNGFSSALLGGEDERERKPKQDPAPRLRLLIFYASHSVRRWYVRAAVRFGTESLGERVEEERIFGHAERTTANYLLLHLVVC